MGRFIFLNDIFFHIKENEQNKKNNDNETLDSEHIELFCQNNRDLIFFFPFGI